VCGWKQLEYIEDGGLGLAEESHHV
jgi:hypothetical protein